ncbi:MAG: nucleotide exchange factor GrpE [Chloroflexi bacterium]|nr:nucleotide exchange factor GrpE [Chloroflexota bacterium]
MEDNAVSAHGGSDQEWKEKLEAAQQEAAENHNKYMRALAESENMRKRLERLCEDRMWQDKKRLLTQFLEVADHLEEALRYADADDPLGAGIHITYQQMHKLLGQEGVQPLQSVGDVFDPSIHEAVDLSSNGESAPNQVTNEYRKGYTLNGRLLRPARVQVNRPG